MVNQILYDSKSSLICHKEGIKGRGDVRGASQLSWPSKTIRELIL